MQPNDDEALEHLAKGLELFPNVSLLLLEKGVALYSKNELGEAHKTLEAVQALGPEVNEDPLLLSFIAGAAIREGRRADGLAVLERLEGMSQKQYVDPSLIYAVTLVLKDPKKNAFWMARLEQDRSILFLYRPLFDRFWSGLAQ